jgi:prenylcysteine oxidase / farnesylcysteine lyase
MNMTNQHTSVYKFAYSCNFCNIVVFLLVLLATAIINTTTRTTVFADDLYNLKQNKKKKIAIIGGGISGTFVTKYLVDYDVHCNTFDTITIFDKYPVNSTITKSDVQKKYQGSRIASYEMNITTTTAAAAANDGVDTAEVETNTTSSTTASTTSSTIVIEVGASILHRDFHHVIEMIQNDTSIQIGVPFTTGDDSIDNQMNDPSSLGIYNGYGQWPVLTTLIPVYLRKAYFLLRYNLDLIKLSTACDRVNRRFNQLPAMLANSDNHSYFFDSPQQIWETINAYNAVQHSFDHVLDVLGISSSIPLTSSSIGITSRIRRLISSLWYQYIPYQGSIRSELLTAINLVNYNQNNTQISGMTGLGSFAASNGDIFGIKGGNYKIIQTAYQQAVRNRNHYCSDENNNTTSSSVNIVTKRIVTVVGDLDGLALFSENNEFVGEYDIVILAAPLQQSQITFLIQSTMDPSIVQPMPLGGLINAHSHKIVVEDHDGHSQLPHPVPDSATRPYTQVVTTIVRDATLNHTVFNVPDPSQMPRSVLMTSNGQISTYSITAITLITKGIYKVFSTKRLVPIVIQQLFGVQAIIEYEQIWGGPYGGATPDYQAWTGSNTTNFLLYDGAIGFHGHTKSGALYYTNTMEQSALSCLEISAIGAKAVAKLIAERVGLLHERPDFHDDMHDEL